MTPEQYVCFVRGYWLLKVADRYPRMLRVLNDERPPATRLEGQACICRADFDRALSGLPSQAREHLVRWLNSKKLRPAHIRITRKSHAGKTPHPRLGTLAAVEV